MAERAEPSKQEQIKANQSIQVEPTTCSLSNSMATNDEDRSEVYYDDLDL